MARLRTDGAFGAELVVEGLAETLVALEAVDPKIRRKLERRIRKSVKAVTDRASKTIRRSGRARNTAKERPQDKPAADSYRIRRAGSSWIAYNMTRSAQITEFAEKTPSGKKQARTLVKTLGSVYGQPGRVLWSSWDDQAPTVIADVGSLVADAERELEAVTG